jgi:rubrerythrin
MANVLGKRLGLRSAQLLEMNWPFALPTRLWRLFVKVRKVYVALETQQSFLETVALAEQNWKAIVEAAVNVEEQSIALYTMALENAKYPSSKVFLRQLLKAEEGHKSRLLAVLNDKSKISQLGLHGGEVEDLKIVDMLEDIPMSEKADYAAILVYAAKREKSTYDYYKTLALGLRGTEMGELFSKLAQEELKHKNRLEREYDECVLTDN